MKKISYSLLFICLSLVAFQPPEQQKIQITSQEFAEQTKPKSGSYLSLLPPDVNRMVKEYAYSGLENEITALRDKYLNDPATRDAFLNNEHFNLSIIDRLLVRFNSNPRDIAIMLNTPASIGFAFASPINDYYSGFINGAHKTAFVLQTYLQNAALTYAQSVAYIRNFIENVRFWQKKFRYSEEHGQQYGVVYRYILMNVIATLLDKFEKDFASQAMPALKVILDVDESLVEYLLQANVDKLKQSPIIVRFIKKNKFWSYTNGIDAFKRELIEAWSGLLREALASNNHAKIAQLLHAVWGQCRSPNTLFKEYFINHVKSPLIDYFLRTPLDTLVFEYIKHFRLSMLFSSETELADLISLELIKKAANADQIIKWFNVIELRFNFMMPTGSELEEALFSRDFSFLKSLPNMVGKNSCTIQELTPEEKLDCAEKIKNRSIRFLLAVVQSSAADAQVLNNLIARGADINGADDQGITILMHAIKNKRFDMANLLLNTAGIDVNACDAIGHNALSYAQFLPDSDQKKILIATLKERGAKEPGVCAIQ